MTNADLLVGNPTNDNSVFCFAKAGEVYLVYLPNGGIGGPGSRRGSPASSPSAGSIRATAAR